MVQYLPDIQRIERWREIRQRIRYANDELVRLDLLRSFGDEIRTFLPDAAKSPTVDRDEIARALEVATVHGAAIGSWLEIDPCNPEWPGRDRLFIVRREDLITCCSVLAGLGLFQPDKIGDIINYVDSHGSKAAVPGIEAPGSPADCIPDLLWESAVESARSKKLWREANLNPASWADEKWAASPAVWRSVAIVDVADAVTAQCRDLPLRSGDAAAGLVVFVKVPRSDSVATLQSWADAGWSATIVNRSDCLGLYQLLAKADFGKPLAVMVAIGETPTPLHISKTIIRRRESGLLGEMSDEQFVALLGGSISNPGSHSSSN